MSLTRSQVFGCDEFHVGYCTRYIGPRGGVVIKSEVWRRNGSTKYWKTRPDEFRIPVKHGLRDYGYIDQDNANQVHAAEDCPLRDTKGEVK